MRQCAHESCGSRILNSLLLQVALPMQFKKSILSMIRFFLLHRGHGKFFWGHITTDTADFCSRQLNTDLLRGNWCNGFWPLRFTAQQLLVYADYACGVPVCLSVSKIVSLYHIRFLCLNSSKYRKVCLIYLFSELLNWCSWLIMGNDYESDY